MKKIISMAVATAMLSGMVTVGATEFKQPDVVDYFSTFNGFKSTAVYGDNATPQGWMVPEFNSTNAYRVAGTSTDDEGKGKNIVKVDNWGNMFYTFDEAIKTGKLHISFDMKTPGISSASVGCINTKVNDNVYDLYDINTNDPTAQVGSNGWSVDSKFMQFGKYNDKASIYTHPAAQVSNSNEYYEVDGERVTVKNDAQWHKYDVLVDFETVNEDTSEGRYKLYMDGEELWNLPMRNQWSEADGVKAFYFTGGGGNGSHVLIDNVYINHYFGEDFEAPVMTIDYEDAGLATQDGSIYVAFSEEMSTDLKARHITVKNKATGETVGKTVDATDTVSGVKLVFSDALQAGIYEVSVSGDVVGKISGKAVTNTCTFEIAEGAGELVGEGAKYYVNEAFNSYKGGMPAGFEITSGVNWTDANAKAMTATVHDSNAAINFAAESNTDIAYEFGDSVYSGKLNVEFDVKSNGANWGVGLMSAAAFFNDPNFISIRHYNQRLNDVCYSWWNSQDATWKTENPWGTWSTQANKQAKYKELVVDNADEWVKERNNEYYNKLRKENTLIGTNADNSKLVMSKNKKAVLSQTTFADVANNIGADTWTHVKAVVDFDAGNITYTIGDASPVTVAYNSTYDNDEYYENLFARDYMVNPVNTTDFYGLKLDSEYVKALDGVSGIRLYGNDVSYDNLKVYTNTSYNDDLNFDTVGNNVTSYGWYSPSVTVGNARYGAHRGTGYMKAESVSDGDKALNFNRSNYLHRYYHPLAVPVKAGTPYSIEFDIKSDNCEWTLNVFDEDKKEAINVAILSNYATDAKTADGKTFEAEGKNTLKVAPNTMGTGNTDFQVSYLGKGGVLKDSNGTKLAYNNSNEWQHIKVLVVPNASNQPQITVSVTKDGITQTSTAYVPANYNADAYRLTQKDVYGIGFFGSNPHNFAINNLKVTTNENVYKTRVLAFEKVDLFGNVMDIEDVVAPTDTIKVKLNAPLTEENKDEAINVYYPNLSKTANLSYTVALEDNGNTASVTLQNPTAGELLTVEVSNDVDFGNTYMSKPETASKTFTIENAETEVVFDSYRMYKYDAGRTVYWGKSQANGGTPYTVAPAWYPSSDANLSEYDGENYKLMLSGKNVGEEKTVKAIVATYVGKRLVKAVIQDVTVPANSEFNNLEVLIGEIPDGVDNIQAFCFENMSNIKPLTKKVVYDR